MRALFRYLLVGLVLCGVWSEVRAQDPQWSQFYASPIYLNPGFTGNTTQGRAVSNYRNQWPSIPGAFISYAFSYDYNLDEFNSGLGFGIQHDRAGTAALRYTNVGGFYAYNIRVSRKWGVRPGLGISYTIRDINYSELTFGDQLITGSPTSTASGNFVNENVSYFDIGSGVIVYSEYFWAGISGHHLNRPNQSLLFGESRLPIRFSAHTGYNIPVQRTVKKKVISSITVAANYKAQLRWDQLDMGAYFNYRPFIAGVWYRGIPFKKNEEPSPNNDAVVALLGMKAGDIRIGYSFDLTVSRLVSNTGGAHEISIIYEHASQRERRKKARSRFLVPCAKF